MSGVELGFHYTQETPRSRIHVEPYRRAGPIASPCKRRNSSRGCY